MNRKKYARERQLLLFIQLKVDENYFHCFQSDW